MDVRVTITPKKGILDPQGVAIERSLPALGFSGVSDVRVGKFIELNLEVPAGATSESVRTMVDDMCRKLLANPIIEDYVFEVGDE